jgi:hypothetical protein
MRLSEFKANLLLMEWHVTFEDFRSIRWEKGTRSIRWMKTHEDAKNSEMVTLKCMGVREEMTETFYQSYFTFQEYLDDMEAKEWT